MNNSNTGNTGNTINFGLTLKNSIQIFKNQFKYLFIPAFILCAITQLSSNYMSSKINIDASNNFKVQNPAAIATIVLITVVIYCFLHGILMLIAYDKSNSKPEISKISSYIIKLMPYLILNFLIYGAVMTTGLLLYILPGIIIMTLFIIYEPIILFEHITTPRCLYESLIRVKSVFFTALLIVIFCLLLEQIPAMLIQSIGSSLQSSTLYGIDQAIEIFINTITLSIVVTTHIAFYYQLQKNSKTKKDTKKPTVSK